MIKYNKNTKILSIKINQTDDIYQVNKTLSQINPNIIVFKHELGYRLVDNLGNFHDLNKKVILTIK